MSIESGTLQPTWPGDKAFVGGTTDASTGLTHLGAREYDPTLGRFISVDPIMDLADPQQMHGYSYANNNPTTHSDPTGLWCDSCNNGNGWPYVGGYEPDNPGPAEPLPPGTGLANDLATKTSERGSKDPAAKRRHAIRDYADIRCVPDGIRSGNICSIPGYEPHSSCLGKEYNMFVWCLEQNPSGKEKLRFREGTGEFIADITGLSDIAGCGEGDPESCALAAASFLPWGKVAKLFKGIFRGTKAAQGGVRLIQGPYGAVSAETLEALASGGGPTTRVVTNLTQAPGVGRGLSVATGDSADALAAAARGGGQMFEANIPNMLLVQLEGVGLAQRRALDMGGVTGEEIRFSQNAGEFIVRFFGAGQ